MTSIPETIQKLEELEWIVVPSNRRSYTQIRELNNQLSKSEFVRAPAKGRICYFVYQNQSRVKLDMNNGEVYYFGDLEEKVRSIIGI